MKLEQLKRILEAAIFAVGHPLPIRQMLKLFEHHQEQPSKEQVKEALDSLSVDCETRGVELKVLASGYQFQSKQDYAPWLQQLWEEKPPRCSRAFLETLALIAYRQPITRGEIEEVRGVAVSTNIIKSLQEREWIKVVGHKEVPGRPALYATTKPFLDHFNLQSIKELPQLEALKDLDEFGKQLDFTVNDETAEASEAELQEQEAEPLVPNEVELVEQPLQSEKEVQQQAEVPVAAEQQ